MIIIVKRSNCQIPPNCTCLANIIAEYYHNILSQPKYYNCATLLQWMAIHHVSLIPIRSFGSPGKKRIRGLGTLQIKSSRSPKKRHKLFSIQLSLHFQEQDRSVYIYIYIYIYIYVHIPRQICWRNGELISAVLPTCIYIYI